VNWQLVFDEVLTLPPHENIEVGKPNEPPENAKLAIGTLRGQLADWEIPLTGGGRIHIVEFANRYLVHWDRKRPSRDPIGHLREDSPNMYNLVMTGMRWLFNRV